MAEDVAEVEPGSVPLVPLKHEIYARERALCSSMEMAAQRAGYAPRCGKSSKLERNPAIQARIAFLAKDEAEIISRKRRRIEEELNAVIDFDIVEFADISEDTGHLKAIDWRKVRDSGASRVVSEFSFDSKTGELTKFKRDDRLNAIAQLRDMHGFKAVTKVAPTDPNGDNAYIAEVRWSDPVNVEKETI